MPVPKRKTSRSRRDKRHANKALKTKVFTFCVNCQSPIMPHQTCMICGFYKGRKILATKLDRSVRRRQIRHELAQRQAQRTQTEQSPAEGQAHNE